MSKGEEYSPLLYLFTNKWLQQSPWAITAVATKQNFIIACGWHAENLYFINTCNNSCEYIFFNEKHLFRLPSKLKNSESVSRERLKILCQIFNRGREYFPTRVLTTAYLQCYFYSHQLDDAGIRAWFSSVYMPSYSRFICLRAILVL